MCAPVNTKRNTLVKPLVINYPHEFYNSIGSTLMNYLPNSFVKAFENTFASTPLSSLVGACVLSLAAYSRFLC